MKKCLLVLLLVGMILLVWHTVSVSINNKTEIHEDKTRDSLINKTITLDSIVNNLKQQIEYDNEKINNLDDSCSIKLFYELVEGE